MSKSYKDEQKEVKIMDLKNYSSISGFRQMTLIKLWSFIISWDLRRRLRL